jgi:uncharacterized membrane protein YkvA (DUF1232 family)
MKLDILSYFGANMGSILGWAFALFILIRLIIGFQSYHNVMAELKRGMKALIFLTVSAVYLISPVDIIPDIILIIGWIDDAVITIGSVVYAQEAINKVFWGEYPHQNRFTAFILWYSGAVVFTYLIKYTIYIV